MPTTIGQLLVDDLLPADMQGKARTTLDKDAINGVLAELAHKHPDKYREFSHAIMQLGRHSAYDQGVTLHLRDTISPVDRKSVYDLIDKQHAELDKTPGTKDERDAAYLDIMRAAQKHINDETYKNALAAENPFALQVKSKARGNPNQLAALLSTPGMYQDSKGNVIPLFVRHSYSEGLKPHEYWASAYGARMSVVSSKFCLSASTPVLMSDYTEKPIESVCVGDTVFTLNTAGAMIPTRVQGVSSNGPRDCYTYTFRPGRGRKQYATLTATPEHKLYTYSRRNGVAMRQLSSCNAEQLYAITATHDDTPGLSDAPSPGFSFVKSEHAGVLPTYDIEVAHPSHRFVLASGLVVSNSTRDAGDLGKQMNQLMAPMLVTEQDCGNEWTGLPVSTDDNDSVGALLSRPMGGYKANEPVTRPMLAKLKAAGVKKIVIRSPLTCGLDKGICKLCAGIRESGRLPELGDNVGINAASALAERIAQTALSQKHSGGTAKGKQQVFSGFDVINNLAEVPSTFPNAATVATVGGEVSKIEPAPQGGVYVHIGSEQHYVPADKEPLVKPGDTVEPGDQLSTGVLNPREVVKYKGIGEGRRYFTNRFTQAMRESGYDVNRRNVEWLGRGLVDFVQAHQMHGAGDALPGELTSYSSMANTYRPRKDAKLYKPQGAVGKYLEQPALHYSIGTQLTKRMAAELDELGPGQVMAHDEPPPFSPSAVRLREAPHYYPDWLARMGSSYLESNLLSAAHRGETSNLHGLHPIPPLAKGVEFGVLPKGQVGY